MFFILALIFYFIIWLIYDASKIINVFHKLENSKGGEDVLL